MSWIPAIVALGVALTTSALGIFVARNHQKWNQPDMTRNMIGFGAGILTALLCLEFLPHALDNHAHSSGMIILSGIVIHFLADIYLTPRLGFLDQWALGSQDHHHDEHCHTPHHEHHHFINPHSACSAAGCLAICSFFDGLQIQASFGLGMETGLLTSVGLFFHVLPDGILADSMILAGGFSSKAAQISSALIGGFVLAGVSAGYLLEGIGIFEDRLLPFASGILLYVCFVHLLPACGQKTSSILSFFGGIVLIATLTHFAH